MRWRGATRSSCLGGLLRRCPRLLCANYRAATQYDCDLAGLQVA